MFSYTFVVPFAGAQLGDPSNDCGFSYLSTRGNSKEFCNNVLVQGLSPFNAVVKPRASASNCPGDVPFSCGY
jgi:hypothetical protein